MLCRRSHGPLRKLGRCIGGARRGFQNVSLDERSTSEVEVRKKLHNSSPRSLHDLLVPSRSELLDKIIAPYIPPKPPQLKMPELESRFETPKLPPGHHFVYFPTSTSELDTLEDGYEKHFAPSFPYRRRLWVTGELRFQGTGLEFGCQVECSERLHKVRVGANGATIWIKRYLFSGNGTKDGPSIIEDRCLRYLDDIRVSTLIDAAENSLEDNNTALNNIHQPLRHTFAPSQLLLTRFAYLTHNFHRIHIDHEYATKTEGYPATLMHGSLSVVLLLTAFRYHYDIPDKRIQRIKYTFYRPLYVDRPVTLTVEPVRDGKTRAILWDDRNKKAVECFVFSPGIGNL